MLPFRLNAISPTRPGHAALAVDAATSRIRIAVAVPTENRRITAPFVASVTHPGGEYSARVAMIGIQILPGVWENDDVPPQAGTVVHGPIRNTEKGRVPTTLPSSNNAARARVGEAGPSTFQAFSLRYWWTKAIAMLPSPTAAATRVTGLNRTSPQAKMPGTLVSRRYGSRSRCHNPAARTSGPVST